MIPTIKEWEKEFNNNTKDLADVINQKAGFKPGQARDKDGKWTDKWAGMKTREQEIKDQKKETALIYDADGNLLKEIHGSETHVDIPTYDLLEAHILTHNHPNNSSFSRADVLFLRNHLNKIRAIGPNGVIHELTINYDALMDYEFKGNKTDASAIVSAWDWAKIFAEAEMKTYLKNKYKPNNDIWLYWRQKDKAMVEASKEIGSYSERIIKNLVNKTPLGKAIFKYKKYNK